MGGADTARLDDGEAKQQLMKLAGVGGREEADERAAGALGGAGDPKRCGQLDQARALEGCEDLVREGTGHGGRPGTYLIVRLTAD